MKFFDYNSMFLCVYLYPYFKEGDCPFLGISCVAEAGRRWRLPSSPWHTIRLAATYSF
jgi:hypothetical protein